MATFYHATNPLVSIDGDDFKCMAQEVSLTVKNVMADDESFCQPGLETPTMEIWTFKLMMKQGFGATAGTDDTWNTLRALAMTTVNFIVESVSGSVAATSPSATFSATLPSIDFLNSKIGKTSPIVIETTVIGTPVFASS